MSDTDEALRARFGALTSDEVAALDRAAGECGVGVAQLMEIAGWQVARWALQVAGEARPDVLVVAGRGNNGGDGLVAARHLASWGCAVRAVVVAKPERVTGIVADHLDSASRCGVDVAVSDDAGAIAAPAGAATIILDALLGTGLTAEPREPLASAIHAVNRSEARVLSVDVPSGLDSTSGRVPEACVRARGTCTLAAMKAGLWQGPARARAGEIVVADIGMPERAWRRCGLAPPSDVRGGRFLPVPSLT